MKKIVSITLACIMMLGVLSGCGAKEEKPAASAPAASAPAAPAAAQYKMRIGSASAETQPCAAVLYDIEKNIEERTNGAIDVEVYVAGQLGADDELARKAMTGAIEVAVSAISTFNTQLAGTYIFYLPFLYAQKDIVETVVTDPMTFDMLAEFDTLGLKPLAVTTSGGTTIASKQEIKSIADMKNFKMRSPNMEAYLSIYQALGINAIPLAFTEVFTAIQQGTVDGAENALATIGANHWDEAGIKYVWATNQIYGFMGYFANQKWFESLPAEYQDIVMEEFAAAAFTSYEDTWEMDQQYIDAQDPFIVHVPTDDELTELKAMTAGIVDEKMPSIVDFYGKDRVQAWFDLIGYDYQV